MESRKVKFMQMELMELMDTLKMCSNKFKWFFSDNKLNFIKSNI